MVKLICLFILCLLPLSILYSETSISGYKIVNKIHLEGNGGWDYLTADEYSGRVFITHGTMVQVIDEKNWNLTGTIPGLTGIHGIALANNLNKGFISDGRDNSIIVFDLTTLAVLSKIQIPDKNPDSIVYDPSTKNIFTFNGGSKNSTVIDAVSCRIVSTIDLDGKPEFACSDGKGLIYVNIEDKNKISLINTKYLTVDKSFSILPGEEPSGLAMDMKNNILFSVCRNKLMVIMDAETGGIITNLPIGSGVDGVVFDRVRNRVYSSNGEGTITVINENGKSDFSLIGNIQTQKGAKNDNYRFIKRETFSTNRRL